MKDDQSATDAAEETASASDAEETTGSEEEEEVKTGEESEEEEGTQETSADESTDSDKKDADDKGSAKQAFQIREEKRLRKAAEDELAGIKATQVANTQEKPEMPKYESFPDVEAYNVAMAKYHEDITAWTLDQRELTAASKKKSDAFFDANAEAYEGFLEKAEAVKVKYPDFHKKVGAVDFSNVARETIYKATNSAEIAIHFANNPELAVKLRGMTAVDTVLTIANMDRKLTQSLKKKTITSAPEPIEPVDGNTGNVKDLSSIKNDDDWYKARKRKKKAAFVKTV